ncbi:hypothetical protein NON00_20470, partial [Roseomonas sp. GC11]|nr:hypothetical protein [Roseomonas sp. GC11]
MSTAPPLPPMPESEAAALLAALRLQLDWGVDEALAEDPLDRLAAPPPERRPAPEATVCIVEKGSEVGAHTLS